MQFWDFLIMRKLSGLFLFAVLISGMFSSSFAFAQVGPIAEDDFYSVDEDSLLTVNPNGVLLNDTNTQSDSFFAIIKTDVGFGTLILNSNGTFTYQPNQNFDLTDSFTYVANNGTHNSDEATVTLFVNPINDAPIALDDSYTTSEDSALVIITPGVIDNDSDVDEDSLLAVLDINTNDGTLVLNSNGNFTYTPNANFVGSDSFTYHVNDGTLDSNIATVAITITSENDTPVAQDDQSETQQNVPISIDVLENDSDVENDLLNILLTVDPSQTKGTAELENSKVLFTPLTDFVGETSFSYRISDGDKTSNLANVTVTVNPINDIPVAVDDSVSTQENTSVIIPVLDNDIDNNSITVNSVTQGINGTVTTNGITITYTPETNFNGIDHFTYVISDGDKTSNSANVTVTVEPNNDSIIEELLAQIQSLFDKILNLEDKITLLTDENIALALKNSELEDIIASGTSSNDDDDDNNHDKVIVCHKDKKSISISEDALPAHLKHGDVIGECNTGDDSDISSKKSVENQIKELKNDFKIQEKTLKNDFKSQEKDLKKQLKDLKKDKKSKDHDDKDD